MFVRKSGVASEEKYRKPSIVSNFCIDIFSTSQTAAETAAAASRTRGIDRNTSIVMHIWQSFEFIVRVFAMLMMKTSVSI